MEFRGIQRIAAFFGESTPVSLDVGEVLPILEDPEHPWDKQQMDLFDRAVDQVLAPDRAAITRLDQVEAKRARVANRLTEMAIRRTQK